MPITIDTYRRVALEDPSGLWEYSCGEMRAKPGMTMWHNSAMRRLSAELVRQLDPDAYEVAQNSVRLRHRGGSYYIPDVAIVPVGLLDQFRDRSAELESYDQPLPFLAEVWSPSTGGFDVDEKIPEYMARGDAEIWRVHPTDRTVVAHRRQADGSYNEHTWSAGRIQLHALPTVSIELARLFR